jgi:hypothetical protein
MPMGSNQVGGEDRKEEGGEEETIDESEASE